jgi:hypothetical protein
LNELSSINFTNIVFYFSHTQKRLFKVLHLLYSNANISASLHYVYNANDVTSKFMHFCEIPVLRVAKAARVCDIYKIIAFTHKYFRSSSRTYVSKENDIIKRNHPYLIYGDFAIIEDIAINTIILGRRCHYQKLIAILSYLSFSIILYSGICLTFQHLWDREFSSTSLLQLIVTPYLFNVFLKLFKIINYHLQFVFF